MKKIENFLGNFESLNDFLKESLKLGNRKMINKIQVALTEFFKKFLEDFIMESVENFLKESQNKFPINSLQIFLKAGNARIEFLNHWGIDFLRNL